MPLVTKYLNLVYLGASGAGAFAAGATPPADAGLLAGAGLTPIVLM